jgi:hypothetical protein
MHKWIQHAEKPLEHSDYTYLTTQICRSNNISPISGKYPWKICPEKGKKKIINDESLLYKNISKFKINKLRNIKHIMQDNNHGVMISIGIWYNGQYITTPQQSIKFKP